MKLEQLEKLLALVQTAQITGNLDDKAVNAFKVDLSTIVEQEDAVIISIEDILSEAESNVKIRLRRR